MYHEIGCNVYLYVCFWILLNSTSSKPIDPLSYKWVDLLRSCINCGIWCTLQIVIANINSYEFDYKTFEYLKAPIDLYFLMDNSNSMENDLENLKALGQDIANTVQEISDEFQIGFGKFVDKVVAPQTDMRPGKLLKPWKNSDPPFSFKNVIPLTAEIKDFIKRLKQQGISGNRDAPEGGFDAMLQVAVCKDNIGWRNETTHLLVFCTESAFHYEADGTNVLAGILKRNDEQCHLSEDGTYTMAEFQDYPSIPMLVRHFARNSIIPIFAITNHAIEYYKRLALFFPDSTIGELNDDSSNIMEILKNSFTVRTTGTSANYYPSFHSKSTNTFRVKLTAQKEVNGKHICEQHKSEREGSFTVKPARFYHGLSINYEILCACPCEVNEHVVCLDLRYRLGKDCSCKADGTHDDPSENCKAPGSSTLCSGHGDCICGECVCTKPHGISMPYYGPFCECNDFSCTKGNDNRICNDNGDCDCGTCKCRKGWNGNACECTQSNETCRDSKGVKIGAKLSLMICLFPSADDHNSQHCKFKDEEDGCIYQYMVDYDPNKSKENHIQALKQKDCPAGSFWWLLPLIMFLIPLLGLTLCWYFLKCKQFLLTGRTVGFKKDSYIFNQKQLTTDYVDTPLDRDGPLDGPDVVEWNVTDNVQSQYQPQPKNEEIGSFTQPESYEYKALVKEVEENVCLLCNLRSYKQNFTKLEKHIVVDTVLPSTRSNFEKILEETKRGVSSGKFNNLPVAPDFYTVASDRGGCTGLMEYQDDVKSQDVRVPLFIKEEDDNKKKLLVKALSVPKGLAHITKPEVNITIIKDLGKGIVKSLFLCIFLSFFLSFDSIIPLVLIWTLFVLLISDSGVLEFSKGSQNFEQNAPEIHVPVTRTRGQDGDMTVRWKTVPTQSTQPSAYSNMTDVLQLPEGKVSNVIIIPMQKPIDPDSDDSFQVVLYEPTGGVQLGQRKETVVTVLRQSRYILIPIFFCLPSEPGRLAFTIVSSTTMQLSWGEPAETNGVIRGYKITYTQINENGVKGNRKRVLLIENLREMAPYRYTVRATNSAGWGPERESTMNIAKQTSRPLSIPIIPDIPIVDAQNQEDYKNYYMYSDSQVNNQPTFSMETDGYASPKKRVTGESPMLFLLSINNIYFPTSPLRSPVPFGIPEAPGRLVFSATGPTSLKVNWQKPFCETNILGYRVTYHEISQGNPNNIEITDPDQTTVNVDHLLPNEAYTFQVMAKSELGWGPDREGVITIESQVNPTTPHIPIPGSPFTLSTPNAPGPLVFAALTHSSLQLRWEKPLKPQGTVIGYTLTCEPVKLVHQPRIFNIEGEDNTQLIVDDLMDNVPYKFKVKSRTSQGFGPEREGIITIEAQDQSMFTRLPYLSVCISQSMDK
uniref:Integrin beta n=1 Tax=Eptatretus burgeri TaxID=7764 RepID=A0A8C4QF84_EPTBU